LQPNSSGKSVYLAQLGIIAFLAHIGSFVPADSAIIGPVDAIFCRMHTFECAAEPQSLFCMDINQMNTLLRGSTNRSLLLVDEFGKGTETIGGSSLLGGAIQHCLARGPQCPSMIVTTHHHELFQHGILTDGDGLKLYRMDLLTAAAAARRVEDDGDDQSTSGSKVTFLYKLVPGFGEASFAFNVARLAGVPEGVVRRGEDVACSMKESKAIPPTKNAKRKHRLDMERQIVDLFHEFDIDNGDISTFCSLLAGEEKRLQELTNALIRLHCYVRPWEMGGTEMGWPHLDVWVDAGPA